MLNGLNFVMVHVPNVEEAASFYTGKLGLEVDQQMPGFVQFKQPGGSGAVFSLGVAEGTEGVQANPIELWWFVEDADAAHDELAGKGVEIASPLADEPFGRTFSIKDPAGHTLYMLQPRQ